MPRVLVVDDSPASRRLLTHILSRDGDITVAGEAANGAEAVRHDRAPRARPGDDGRADARHGRVRGDAPHHARDAHAHPDDQRRPARRGRVVVQGDRGGRPDGAGEAPGAAEPAVRGTGRRPRPHGQGARAGEGRHTAPAPGAPAAGRPADGPSAGGGQGRSDRRFDGRPGGAREGGVRPAGGLRRAGARRPAHRRRLRPRPGGVAGRRGAGPRHARDPGKDAGAGDASTCPRTTGIWGCPAPGESC